LYVAFCAAATICLEQQVSRAKSCVGGYLLYLLLECLSVRNMMETCIAHKMRHTLRTRISKSLSLSHTHTHTHTQTHTHTHTQTYMSIHTHTRTRKRTHSFTQAMKEVDQKFTAHHESMAKVLIRTAQQVDVLHNTIRDMKESRAAYTIAQDGPASTVDEHKARSSGIGCAECERQCGFECRVILR